MGYHSLQQCLLDLEKNGHLVRVKEMVDPDLEMAAVHLRIHDKGGPALLFENVKGCSFRAASNIFGTVNRSKFIFRDTWDAVQKLIALKDNPLRALRNPVDNAAAIFTAIKALPFKNPVVKPSLFQEIPVTALPLIKHWPMDGGAFITLPQVYTEDVEKPGIYHSNLGMYRIQLTGNEYIPNKEIGLHYQLHRGIGIHHLNAHRTGKPLKVSVFVGGPPAHTVAAVMPLPEGMSELTFAGILGNRRFRYVYRNGYCISTDADFVITGEVFPDEIKPEGPFGDHLGYYSLQHPFPVMKVNKVFARKNAIWPFTVVGRPPQEDTSFGKLIHELTGAAVKNEIPGVKEVHAVDAAGVHPLLLAIGSERYTPFAPAKQPAEILTIANRILGTGQLSLAKYVWITADDTNQLRAQEIPSFFNYVLKRINWERDVHFYTQTTIDTLDYSGEKLNSGSKVVFASHGDEIRQLCKEIPSAFYALPSNHISKLIMPGVIALQINKFSNYNDAQQQIATINRQLENTIEALKDCAMIILVDDASFVSETINNFLWVTFTRSNPSHDIYGIAAFTQYKHWGCKGPLIIDARIKPHHAPAMSKDSAVETRIDRLFEKGGSLYNYR